MRQVRQRVTITPLPDAEPQAPLLTPDPGFDATPKPWEQVYVLPDGQTLEISAMHGSLERLHSVEVDESQPDVVLLTVWIAFTEPVRSGFRTLVGYPFHTRVLLERPLEGRSAMDGALGTEAQVREQELETAVRWRAEIGLPTDRRLVAELVDDARMPDGRLYGQEVMSDDEARWYQQALDDKEAAANFAKEWLAEQGEDLDGHGLITSFNGGDFVQYVTGGADALRSSAEEAGIRRLRVEQVTYSYRRLDRFHELVREKLISAGFGIWRSGPDVRANLVRLTVDGDVSEARRLAGMVAPAGAISITPVS